MKSVRVAFLMALVGATTSFATGSFSISPVPYETADALQDKATLMNPSHVKLEGFLGARIAANESNRLLKVDEEPLLAGYRKKPGTHPWIGEHAGKWLHAATLAWANTGDPALRAKLDRFASDLIKTQEADGYMGTYEAGKRFGLFQGADWDVWSLKYCLIGLLTYYQYTGNTNALVCCRRAGDLLVNTFGPGKKSILSAGTHVGMAATSVLEPVVMLYRFTGDARYLDFAKYIVKSWDEPNGPKILATLLAEKSVRKTANAKAYEMLSNLVGLCELARATGDTNCLQACLNAWDDITAHRIYLTGSISSREHFQDEFNLPNGNDADICETCVSVTWLQFNAQLLRLTGDAKYGNEIERTLYNHLAAAQRPDGSEWCYYTPLEGRKPYGHSINCCLSSGPRGMALAPTLAFANVDFGGEAGFAVNTFESSQASAKFGGKDITFELSSEFPKRGAAQLRIKMASWGGAKFPVEFRVPAWASPLEIEIDETKIEPQITNGWAVIPARKWHNGDKIDLSFTISAFAILGNHGNANEAALRWGPFVLAYDSIVNRGLPAANSILLAPNSDGPPCALMASDDFQFSTLVRSVGSTAPLKAKLVPFANAGASSSTFRVWIPDPSAEIKPVGSLLEGGIESRSRKGNRDGSANDGMYTSFVCTFDNAKADADWFAVTLPAPVKFSRVVFAHGRSFHDGGWFDASRGKPKIQIMREANAAWETVAELASYPDTTASDSRQIADGQSFSQSLPQPVSAVALRILGCPASGDDPKQSFSTCGELQAFAD